MKVLLFSYAGSLGNAYRKWEHVNSQRIKFLSMEYPGKGQRSHEAAAKSWKELILDGVEQVTHLTEDSEPYFLFGHSMGAKVAYDVCLSLQQQKKKLPACIFFSGTKPFSKKDNLFLDNDILFRDKMLRLGGIPQEVLDEPELAEYIFSILRGDAQLIDEFIFDPEFKISVPAIVFEGIDDAIGTKDEWRDVLGNKHELKQFPGGHFFIFEHPEKVINQIEKFI